MSRQVVKKVQNREQSEGVGAKVRRSIGSREVLLTNLFFARHYI